MEMETVGRYQIKSEMGRGGMATVYLADDPSFEREVAVKVLPREFLHDPTFLARFEREAKTIAGLEHTAIVPVYDFGESGGQPYLVMRYMMGGSLHTELERGPVSIPRAKKVIAQVAGALDYAHLRGIIHRDLKPGNLLFDDLGNAYLTDFGIVKLTQETSTLTGDGVIGTPAYMSPEQAQGVKELDGRSDVYSLGVILFHMLTGAPPYEADTPIGLAVKHVTEPVPRILEVRADLPSELDALLQCCLAKSPTDRFDSAQEFSDALNAIPEEQVEVVSAVEETVVHEELESQEDIETILDPGEKLTRIDPAPVEATWQPEEKIPPEETHLPEGISRPETPEELPKVELPIEPSPKRRGKGLWWVLGVIGMVGIAAIVFFVFGGTGIFEPSGISAVGPSVSTETDVPPAATKTSRPSPVSPTSPPPTSALIFEAAVGEWEAIDNDGSEMTLTIRKSGYGGFIVEYYDAGASGCGTDAFGTPRYAAKIYANGRSSGSTLLLSDVTVECVGLEDSDLTATVQFQYFPSTDRLRDSFGVEWTRVE